MPAELDHLFVCARPGAPEAERLIQLGLSEAPPNQHPGQGTANRRFSFANAMIELLWVSDASEAQSEPARRTLLWERWSVPHTCPFGIAVRPADPENAEPPFPGWQYRPAYLPDPLAIHIADTGVDEPMWFYMSFMRRLDWEQRFIQHPLGVREITGLVLTSPAPLRSAPSLALVESGILSIRQGTAFLLEVAFDSERRGQVVDLRPHLPLLFRL